MKLEILDSGIIYKKINPGFKAESAYLPNLVAISENEILCFMRIGSAFFSTDGKIWQFRSLDCGKTWVQEKIIVFDGSDIDYHYSSPHCTLTSNGELVLLVHREKNPTEVAETYMVDQKQKIIFTSTDKGHNWEGYQIDIPAGEHYIDTPSNIIELNNGSWFLACEEWENMNNDLPIHIKGFGLLSKDRGKNWKSLGYFPSSFDNEKMFSHSRYTKMIDGRIAVLQWAQKIGGQDDLDAHITISDIDAKEWILPKATGIPAQTSWLADMGNGVIVALYTHRTGFTPGIKVLMSTDFGDTWDNEDPLTVWDSVGQEFLGVNNIPDYPKSHDNIAFGKPNLIRTGQKDLIASWWCTQACITHARYARIRLK